MKVVKITKKQGKAVYHVVVEMTSDELKKEGLKLDKGDYTDTGLIKWDDLITTSPRPTSGVVYSRSSAKFGDVSKTWTTT